MKNLKRYPYQKNDQLQAWNAADELLLKYVKTLDLSEKDILIINDHFGALSSSLLNLNIDVYTDSFTSSEAIKFNCFETKSLNILNDLDSLKKSYDYVFIQMPKNLSFFEDILIHLNDVLHDKSKVICTGMVKYIRAKNYELLEKYIGKTKTSLSEKKARLSFSDFKKKEIESKYPLSLFIEGFEKNIINHSNVFSREKLDIGTRFLLEQLKVHQNEIKILDMGCGNGVVGIKAKFLNPASIISFTDESMMAIKSAQENYGLRFDDLATFSWDYCYENKSESNFDLVVCNPPFHQGHSITKNIAFDMIKNSLRVLKSSGRLLLIGNNHLGYQVNMKKIFGNSQIIASNKKFMVIESLKI